MSRCFPFPPPGYEFRDRPDHVNLIIKDKQKHKKHKDKKDKDKKKRSERKEKEGSEDKHKDDKKRKRKEHRDEKDKNNDNQSSSREVKRESVGSLANENGPKLVPVPDSKPTEIEDKRTIVELANRVRNNDGATSNHMVQKITFVEKEKVNVLGKALENGNGMLAVKGKRDYNKMSNVQSLTVDSRSLGNGSFKSYYGDNQINVEGSSCQVDMVEKRKEGKEMYGYGYNVAKGDGSKNGDQKKITKAEDERENEKKKDLMGFGREKFIKHEKSSDFLDFHSKIPSDLLKANRDCGRNLPKLEELNDFLHAEDNGVRPSNMAKPLIVSHQVGQTGSDLRPSQNMNLGVEKCNNGVRPDNMFKPMIMSHQVGQTGSNHRPSQNTFLSVEKSNNGVRPNNMAKPLIVSHQFGQTGSDLRPSQNMNLGVEKCNNGVRPDNMFKPMIMSHQVGQTGSNHRPSQNTFLSVEKSNNGVRPNNMAKPLIVSHQFGQTGSNLRPSQNTNLSVEKSNNGVRPNNISKPLIVSHQVGQTGSDLRPSQITNLDVEKNVLIIDQKVNGFSSPQSVIDDVRNVRPCQTANNAKPNNGMVSINNRVVSNGIISPHIIHIERKMEPCETSNSAAVVKKIANPSADGKIPSSHSFVEDNGKMDMQASDVVQKMMHNKELSVNGSLQGKNHSSSMLSSDSLKRKEKRAKAIKPHPDLKYLSQILTVPQLVEWPQFDDQEWLFGHRDSHTKRPKLASPEIQCTKQVWSEAVKLESAEVTALPYVIPY